MTPSSDPEFDAILARFMRDFEAADDKAAVVERYCAEFPQYAAYWRAHAARHQQMHVAAPGVAPPMPRLKAGDHLGEFTIVDYLAGGGMGEIYLAKQRHVNERLVAIKIIRGGHVSPRHRQRFERELAVLAKLHQTNIVPVYGAGEQDDIQYIAMQYIDGASVARIVSSLWERHSRTGGATQSDSLAKVVESVVAPAEPNAPTRSLHPGDEPAPAPHTPPSLTDVYMRSVAAALAEVAEALHVAHAAKVLHRDVKPSNLMIEKKSGKCWLIDFGLAGLVEGGPPEPATPTAPTLTAAGDVLGTFAYMAPEQFDGHADERSDVWGLGVTLYELLTLRRAFNEKTEAEYKHAIQQTRPLAPGTLVRKLPRDLEAICAKAMHRTAADRYATAGEFAADLRRWLRREPTIANPPWVWRRVGMWSRRNPGWAAALAATWLALLTIAGFSWWIGHLNTRAAERESQIQTAAAEERVLLRRRALEAFAFRPLASKDRTMGWRDREWEKGKKLAEHGMEPELRDHMASLLGGLDAKRDESFQEGSATFLAFSPNGERLLMGGYRSRNPDDPKDKAEPTRVRDLASGTVRPSEQWAVGPVAWRGDMPVQLIPPRPFRPTYRLWNVDRNALVEEFTLPPGYTPKLAPNIEGQNLAGVVLSADASRIAALAVDPQGQRVIVLWKAGARRHWEILPQPGPRLTDDPEALTLSPVGSLLALGTHDGKVHVWSLVGTKPTDVNDFQLGRSAITGLTFGRHRYVRDPVKPRKDGSECWLLGVGAANGTVAVWNLANGDQAMHSRESQHQIFSLAFSRDGVTVYTTGRNQYRCWDVATGRQLLLANVGNWIPCVTLHPDGKGFAIAAIPRFGSVGGTHAFIVEPGRGVQTLRGLTGRAIRVTGTPDGARYGFLTQDLQVGVWDRASGELLLRVDAPPSSYPEHGDLKLSADGRVLVIVGDQEVHRWELPQLRAGHPPKRHSAPLKPGFPSRLAVHAADHITIARAETLSRTVFPYSPLQRLDDTLCVRIYEWKPSLLPTELVTHRVHHKYVQDIRAASNGSCFVSGGYDVARKAGYQFIGYHGRTGEALWPLPVPVGTENHTFTIDSSGTLLYYTYDSLPGYLRTLPLPGLVDSPARHDEILGLRDQIAFRYIPDSRFHLCIPGKLEPFVVLGENASTSQQDSPFTLDGRYFAWGDAFGFGHVCDMELVKKQLVTAGFAGW